MTAEAWLNAPLNAPLIAMAFCWRIARRDGVVIGLTSHDRALDLHGLRYEPAPGLVPTAIEWDGSASTDPMEIAGAISSDALTDDDLDAGRWDGAGFTLTLTDWTSPGTPWIPLVSGQWGTVERREGAFSVTLRGRAARVDRPFAPETSPTCRARLGDRNCRVDLAQYQRVVRIASGPDADGAITTDTALPAGMEEGTLRWLTGANAGLWASVRRQDGSDPRRLWLDADPPGPVMIGDRARITAGCDRTIATCATRFGNVAQFRGEAFLPGTDLLLRYPDAG